MRAALYELNHSLFQLEDCIKPWKAPVLVFELARFVARMDTGE
jgi:hypothetical protein